MEETRELLWSCVDAMEEIRATAGPGAVERGYSISGPQGQFPASAQQPPSSSLSLHVFPFHCNGFTPFATTSI